MEKSVSPSFLSYPALVKFQIPKQKHGQHSAAQCHRKGKRILFLNGKIFNKHELFMVHPTQSFFKQAQPDKHQNVYFYW